MTSAKCLLIDRVADKILLSQEFFDPAIMVLKRDGQKGEKFILTNEILIPDLDIKKYLQELYYQKNSIKTVKLKNGQILEVHQLSYANDFARRNVTIDMTEIDNGRYITEKGNIAVVDSGKLENFYSICERKLANSEIIYIENPINQVDVLFPINSIIYNSDKKTPLEDGKYTFSNFLKVIVENGRISKTTIF